MLCGNPNRSWHAGEGVAYRFAHFLRQFRREQGADLVPAAGLRGPVVITIKGGQFTHALGSEVPLAPQLLASLAEAWLGVTVGNDPELASKQLRSEPFTLRAAVAEGIDCSGCVGLSQLDAKALAGKSVNKHV